LPELPGGRGGIRAVLSEEGIEARIEMVAVDSGGEAERLRFPGSPTIQVEGEDVFPVPERESYALGCRTYPTPEGLRGWPTTGMLRASLKRKRGTRAGDDL
jgi:hypothetical protein